MWVRQRYYGYGWKVVLACMEDGPWVKARAVTPALEQVDAKYVVIADADVWCDGLREALAAVGEGAPWAKPHAAVHRLTEDATRDVILGEEPTTDMPLDQPAYRGLAGGGLVVARRDTLLDIQLDPRFIGWGGEDESLGIALNTLAGAPWLGDEPLYHLWHPAQQRASRRWGSVETRTLAKRYHAAHRDPTQMRTLIEEAKHAPTLDQSEVHADPAGVLG
jgi:hypothetical protein